MKTNVLFILGLLGIATYVFAYSPPKAPVTTQPIETQQFHKTIENNWNVLEVTTTAPNGNIRGMKGKLILYDNGGTLELWGNYDGLTTWQKLSP